MLFLGTKKYPKEAEYKQFLKDHGGSSNASTGMHDTCFQFDVGSDHLAEAMDRFAQFFIAPLFTESATDRELNAVNSEFHYKQQNDNRRLYQFDKSLASPQHPFYKFSTGNLQTLREDVDESVNVRSELLSFYEAHYSSSVMKLAVVGKEGLDALSQMVVDTFSAIKNRGIKRPQYAQNAFDESPRPILYKVFPIKERR